MERQVVAGVVAEYNPFHNGHRYQLKETRRLGATHIVAVMGGNFLQRGAPALVEKHWRARAALLSGADLVLELPLPWACATAERFAFGAVSLLDALGVVEMLSFGSEAGDAAALAGAARAVDHPAVEEKIPRLLERGCTYAAARQQAVEAVFGPQVAGLLSSPNDILGVEYLRQLTALGSAIRPVSIPRAGAGHHGDCPQDGTASASWLRARVEAGRIAETVPYMPAQSLGVLEEALAAGESARPELLERPLLARLRTMPPAELAALPDISEGLEHRIFAAVKNASSLEELLESVKTKRYTHARLRRVLLSAWLGLTADLNRHAPPYLRVLGMNDRGTQVLSMAKGRAKLPLSHSLAELERRGGLCTRTARLEAVSTDLYHTITPRVLPCGLDYTLPMIRVGKNEKKN